MCGLSAYYANESVPSDEELRTLFGFGALRGSDAFGFVHVSDQDEGLYEIIDSEKIVGHADHSKVAKHITEGMDIGDLVMAIHRASPETEPDSEGPLSIQPIMDEANGVVLIHNGAVSNMIYNELKDDYDHVSELDSEAIIWAYLHHGRNMKRTMEYLSGGFAFLLFDLNKEKLYAVASHLPLWCGYVRGCGLFFSSLQQAIYATISQLKGETVTRMNNSVWEDYYCREVPANTAIEIDLQSGNLNEHKFTPRYIHPTWDPIKQRTKKQKVLVLLSGGLDSATTLAILKAAGYDTTAIHFKYGHRGGDCELMASRSITSALQVPCIEIGALESCIPDLDGGGLLTNPGSKITTGTGEGLKSTIAWTCFRNGLFLCHAAATAESLITKGGYGEVWIAGGYANLTESGVYPDNSERFISSFHKFVEFASIAGTMIKPMYVCSNLLKTEQYFLLDRLGLLKDLGPHLISCDRPKMVDGVPKNCSKDGLPACGSGLLSYWAAKKAGVADPRLYYEVDDPDYMAHTPASDLEPKSIQLDDVLKKIQLHPLNMRILQRRLKAK